MSEIVVLVGLFLGVLFYFIIFDRRKEKLLSADPFWVLGISIVITLLLYSIIPPLEIKGISTGLEVFSFSFGVGFGWQSFFSRIYKWMEDLDNFPDTKL